MRDILRVKYFCEREQKRNGARKFERGRERKVRTET